MMSTRATRALAKSILKHIELHPEHFDMSDWFTVSDDPHEPLDVCSVYIEENYCNTTMCVAGTAMFLDQGIKGLSKFVDKDDPLSHKAISEASKLLGLNKDESNHLFFNTTEGAIRILESIAAAREWDVSLER